MMPESFEKDADKNGHIDFITAASVRLESGKVSKGSGKVNSLVW